MNVSEGIMQTKFDFCHMINRTNDEITAKSERMTMKREVIIWNISYKE